jgi:hypothetical protein
VRGPAGALDKRMRLLALAPLCLLACKTAGPVRASVDGGEGAFVASLRAEHLALEHRQRLLGWLQETRGEPARGPVAARDLLFRSGALDAVDAGLAQAARSPNDALALRFLRRALTSERVSLATLRLDDQLAQAETTATVALPWLPAALAYRDLPAAIALEADPGRRQLLYAAGLAVVEKQLNPLLERREALAQAAARTTGFADYVALSEELRSVRLPALLAEGARYVQATDELFTPLLDRVAREELGIPPGQLHLADLARLWKAPALLRHFDPALELPALRCFLGGIGLDLRTAAGTEVQVDDSALPQKQPRAFVEPVDAPADVRLSVKPSGGLDGYWSLFHEAGHAVHFANATIAPRELLTLGHGAPSEAFGELFRQAFADPRWLFRYRAFLVAQGRPAPSNAELAAVLRRTALVEMLYLRRYAFAKIAFELRLHGRGDWEIAPALALLPPPSGPRDLRELYRALFSRAYGFELTAEESQRYRVDVDETFYAADYARAFALAGMLHEGLRRRFGDDWYGDPAVGAFLKRELFAPGESLSAEEVAQRLGFAPRVDFELAARRARRLLAEADALEHPVPAQRFAAVREADAPAKPQ